ncbi:hypothetical protein [Blastococcus sp. SYSU D00695]
MSEPGSGRTPHPDQPAESGAQEPGSSGSGRTPHPEEPAEGAERIDGEEVGGQGADTPS